MDRYFSNIAFRSTERALNLLDRNPYSKTFGCFDRYYWHFKTKDFPSSSYQMGVEFLSRLWNDSHKDNVFYKNPQLLSWIKAGIEYTCSVQNKDGSFDEWYPNERGWAGPTSYVVHSLISAYRITEGEWDEELKTKACDCFLKAGRFLIRQKEGARLANHYALFLLSLYEIFQVTAEPAIKSHFESSLKVFGSFVSEEGWSIEYDSVDFGYNLATLSFLARLDKLYPEPLLKQYAEKNFCFLSYFFYPDGSFGGLGSRETIHLYPYAFKYWNQSLSLAGQIYYHLMEKKSFEKLTPSDQDDHYLFYRLSEYLEADEIKSVLPDNTKSEWTFLSKTAFRKHFPESGLFVNKSDNFYLVVNMKKGGALRVYNVKTGHCLLKNNGWVGQLKDRLQTSLWYSEDHQIEMRNNEISIGGKGAFLTQKYFNSLKFIFFRLMTMLAGNYRIAFLLKKIIRQLLITQKKKPGCSFKRVIQWNDKTVTVKDFIGYKKAVKIFYGGAFSVRYVPQSNYFEMSDLQNSTSVFTPDPKQKRIIVKQVCDLKDVKTELEFM